MADISSTWDKTKPAGTDPIATSDDNIRSNWGAIEDTVEEEHYMGDSTTSAGIHKIGSARIYAGDSSAVSSSGADAESRLMYAVDENELYFLGGASTNTLIIGAGSAVKGAADSGKEWYVSYQTYAAVNALSKYTFKVHYDEAPVLLHADVVQDFTSGATKQFFVDRDSIVTNRLKGWTLISATGEGGAITDEQVYISVMGKISSSSVS